MMRTVFFPLALLSLSTIVAQAADLPSINAPPVFLPPAMTSSWSGFYAGLNQGYISQSKSFSTIGTDPSGGANLYGPLLASSVTSTGGGTNNGFLGGAQIGYNYQITKIVVGLEGDFDGTVAHGSQNLITPSQVPVGPPFPINGQLTVNKSLSYLATVRARFGYIIDDKLLVYATGGAAFGKVSSSAIITENTSSFATFFGTPGSPGSVLSSGSTRVGYVVGAGAEYMIMANVSLKAEAMYYDLGRSSTSGYLSTNVTPFPGPTATRVAFSSRTDGLIARVGLNYHFNMGSPVVARY